MSDKIVVTGANFDLETMELYLKRLPALLESGFENKDVVSIVLAASKLAAPDCRVFQYSVCSNNLSNLLEIVVLTNKDGFEVAFRGTGLLIERIEKDLFLFLNSDIDDDW